MKNNHPLNDGVLKRGPQIPDTIVNDQQSTHRAVVASDVRKVLDNDPSLMADKSVVLELASQEYRARLEKGENLSATDFVQQFHVHQSSLFRMLIADSIVDNSTKEVGRGADVNWPRVGDRVLNFYIEKLVGVGAVARAYLATDEQLGERRVVIKVARFAGREASLLGKLNHANIIPVHSIGHDTNRELSVVCMPYLGEATLADLVRAVRNRVVGRHSNADVIVEIAKSAVTGTIQGNEKPASQRLRSEPFDVAVAFLGQRIARALDHLHARGITHQDLKPANILLTPQGEPVLLDFNLATEVSQDFPALGGTVPYMAPERLRDLIDQNPRIGAPTADIFSLGVLMYELLTGHLPFGDPSSKRSYLDSAQEMLDRMPIGATPLEHWTPTCCPRLSALVMSCLRTDSTIRPSSAKQLAEQLGQYVRSRRRGKWFSLFRQAGAFIAGAVLCALLIGLFSGLSGVFRPLGRTDDVTFEIAELTHKTKIKPTDAQHWLELAQAYAAAKQWNHALDCLIHYSRHSKSIDPSYYAIRAYYWSRLDSPIKEMGNYDIALQKGFDTIWVRNNFAFSLIKIRNTTKAHSNATLVMQKAPELVSAYYLRCLATLQQIYFLNGCFASVDEALTDCTTALELAPDDPTVHFVAAQVFAWRARLDFGNSDDYRELARNHLLRSAELGMDRRQIREDIIIPDEIRREALKIVTSGGAGKDKHCRNVVIPPPAEQLFGRFAKYYVDDRRNE